MPTSSTTNLLQKALALHRHGAIAEAAAIYVQVQRADPHNADAPYYLATIACQQGRFTEGRRSRATRSRTIRGTRAHTCC
jgi:thioredoxin-like negative regulator of GroEL